MRRRVLLALASLPLAACGTGDARTAEADTPAPAVDATAGAGAADVRQADAGAPATAGDTAAAPARGTATVRITGGPRQVAGDYPAASCADPMVQMGDTREGLVYAVAAGPHRIVLQDHTKPAPGPQRIAPVLGGTSDATMSFLVNAVEERRAGLMRDDDKPHSVTLGPDFKTAEASGTFVDMDPAGTGATYAVSVRFTCK